MITLEPQQVYLWRAHRHGLLERAPHKALVEVVDRLGGLQAQVMSAAELQLWARVEDITPEDIRAALWQKRSLVKTWAWRGTLHLLAARRLATYVGALSTRARRFDESWLRYLGLTQEMMDALRHGIRDALDGKQLTRDELADEVVRLTGLPELREMMTSGWGSLLKPSAFNGDLCFGPSKGQAVTFVRPDQWIGDFEAEDPVEATRQMLRRYLATYGPASREDFSFWFGMTPPQGGRVVQAIVDELEPVSVEGWGKWKGWALKKDVIDIQSFHASPAVRLLPNFDPFVVARSHAAMHAVPDHQVNKARVYRVAGWVTPVVLVDGRIEGIWAYEKRRSEVLVKVETFGPLTAKLREGIEKEVEKLGRFLGAKAELEMCRLDKF